MADDRPPSFEPLRTSAFKSILVMAFKVFPARVVEVMKAHGWFSFVDFMGDIAIVSA